MFSTGRLTVKCLEIRELWYVAYMLAYASVLHLTICWITWSLWRGTRGLTKLGLKFVSCLVKHGMCISGGVGEPMLGYSWAWTFGLYHPCILLAGLTHAWSIRIFAVCFFEYIIEFWALWCDLPIFAML